MANILLPRRIFAGEKYIWLNNYSTKREANKEAAWLRSQGNKVRVTTGIHGLPYTAWIRWAKLLPGMRR